MQKQCCSSENKMDGKVEVHTHEHHGHSHHLSVEDGVWRIFAPAVFSLILLLIAIAFDHLLFPEWFKGWLRILWYLAAYIPVGGPVIKDAFHSIRQGDVYSEFFLMTIATGGAFAIGVYPEAVAVMLFYTVGDIFQSLAVTRASNNIENLLDNRPDEVFVLKEGKVEVIKAKDAAVDSVIQLKPGDKLALDGILISDSATFNTSALTGESKPDTKYKGEAVLAGMINQQTIAQVQVTTKYSDSKLSRILEMVQEATSRKAPTELFISKFAKVYTPIVVYLAVAICFLPWLFTENYVFTDWLYRALIFLVISCPCALVISIPLGYFGGIGAGSRNGILFKGSNYLDVLAKIQHVAADKTGTMTEGIFAVKEVVIKDDFDRDTILKKVNLIESHSSHPIATAIHEYVGTPDSAQLLEQLKEIPGHGLYAWIEGKEFLAGNFKLLDKYKIPYDVNPDEIDYTTVAMAEGGKFVGYITIADRIREDAFYAVEELKKIGVNLTMLSGDKPNVVDITARELGIAHAYGGLLPEDKVHKLEEIKQAGETVAFVGDGINDAPVLAISDVGIAMGGLGSDATIEAADVVIQDDMPSKVPMAIKIGKKTRMIVWQNISLAFGVKALVLILGAGGLATMWEAVFADVGVALMAIFNAIRIQRMRFSD